MHPAYTALCYTAVVVCLRDELLTDCVPTFKDTLNFDKLTFSATDDQLKEICQR